MTDSTPRDGGVITVIDMTRDDESWSVVLHIHGLGREIRALYDVYGSHSREEATAAALKFLGDDITHVLDERGRMPNPYG